MTQQQLFKAAIYSLAFLWIFTGLTSMFFAPEIGYEILAKAAIHGPAANLCLFAGALLDIAVGLWLLTGKQRKRCCQTQTLVIVSYSLLLTYIDSSFWLHPFGPLTKNLPILVLIGIVYLNTVKIND